MKEEDYTLLKEEKMPKPNWLAGALGGLSMMFPEASRRIVMPMYRGKPKKKGKPEEDLEAFDFLRSSIFGRLYRDYAKRGW